MDEEIEVEQDRAFCPRSHSCDMGKPGLERQSDTSAHGLNRSATPFKQKAVIQSDKGPSLIHPT